jgi:signal transduction histidine kinase
LDLENLPARTSAHDSVYLTREQLLRRQFLGDLLRARAAGGAAATLVLLALSVLWPETQLLYATLVALAVPVSSGVLLFWLRYGGSMHVRLVAHLTLVIDTLLITAATLALGGVNSGVPALYLWVLVASGLLFHSRAVPIYTLVCFSLSGAMFAADTFQLYTFMPAPSGLVLTILRATVLALSALMAALGTYTLVRAQERVVAEVEMLNTELERRVGAATLDLAEALRETKELHDGLNESYEKLNRLQRFRDEMTHMIVHDLKSPLSNVSTTLGIIRVLLEEHGIGPGSEEEALLAGAELSAEQMARLIANLLDLHRLEEGRLQVHLAPLDLAPTLRERCQQVEARLAQKRLGFAADIPEHLPPAQADDSLFARVVDNLLDNAIKYTPSGGSISLSVQPDNGCVVVRVADNGPGIPEFDRERVFEKFEQLSGDRRGDFGVGLGLAFCKMAVQAQGGRIWVAPESEGATFCVALTRLRDNL